MSVSEALSTGDFSASEPSCDETGTLQSAIDAAHAQGGGRVDVLPGRHRIGSLQLKSGVELFLEAGATLVGSTNEADYKADSILWAKDARDIALSGRGSIEGAGSAFADKKGFRPYNIHFQRCRGVRISDVRLTKSSSWMQRYSRCDDVWVRGIRVFNFDNYNADGIDFVSCRNVIMSDSVIHSDDDAFCLKTESDEPCENITVTNCVFGSHCNAIKVGTESYGDFRNITISNCVVAPPPCDKVWYGRREGHGGIVLGVVDGGTLDNVMISQISIRGTLCPLFLRLGNRGRPYETNTVKPTGRFRRVVLSNIQAVEGGCFGSEITGIPGHPIHNLTLDNVRLSFLGGGPLGPESNGGVPVAEIPVSEHEEGYPRPGMHGCLPSYGLFIRHVEGLNIRNLELSCEIPESRTALLMNDIHDLRMTDLRMDAPEKSLPPMRLDRVRSAALDRLTVRPDTNEKLVLGADCDQVTLDGALLRPA